MCWERDIANREVPTHYKDEFGKTFLRTNYY